MLDNEEQLIVKIHRGDDTEAFNGGLFKIDYTDAAKTINKLELTVGSIVKVYNLPQFPLQVDFSAAETMLNKIGIYDINLVAYDERYKRLNIYIDTKIEFVPNTEQFIIPYESPTIFDFGNIFTSIEMKNESEFHYLSKYNKLDYEYANEYFSKHSVPVSIGGCTSVRNGSEYGRNIDWLYSDMVEFVIRTDTTLGVAGGNSVFTKQFVEETPKDVQYKILPFYLQDGINKDGVFANINVVTREADAKGINTHSVPAVEKREEVCAIMLVRYILDKFSSATEAVEYIRDYVDIFLPKSLNDIEYECHFMIGDRTKTYVLEIVNNAVVFKEHNILSNFFIDGVTFNEDGTLYSIKDITVVTPESHEEPESSEEPTEPEITYEHLPSVENGLMPYSSGVERYNIAVKHEGTMRELMNKLIYTHTYSDAEGEDFWYSEYTGEGLTIDNPVSDYEENGRIGRIKETYRNRTRENPITWQSVHSSVYNLDKLTLNLVVQEDTSIEFNYKLNE